MANDMALGLRGGINVLGYFDLENKYLCFF
jgi:hypothetical protein